MSTPATPTRRFLHKSAIYAIGDLLTKGSRFILVPFYVAVFAKAEVGRLAVLQSITMASIAVLTLGLGFTIRRFHVDHESSTEAADKLVSTLYWARNLGAIPLLCILGVAGWYYADSAATSIPFGLIAVALVSGFFRSALNLYEARLLVREEAVRYRIFTFCQFGCVTTAIIVAVVGLKLGVRGAVWAECLVTGIWFLGVTFVVTRRALPDMAAVDWKTIGTYSLPVIPHAVFMWALASSDRILLGGMVSEDEVAVYDIGYLIASVLSVCSNSMRAAWFPSFFREAHTTEGRKDYGQTATLYFGIVGLGAVALVLFAPEILQLLAKPGYASATGVARVVVPGIALMTMFVAANQPLFYARATGTIAAASGLGFVVNIASNVVLIPRLGIMGAAFSTILAYGAMAAFTFVMTQRRFAVTWNFERLTLISLAAVVIAIAGSLFPSGTVLSFISRLGLLAAASAAVFFLVKPTRGGLAVSR